MTTPDRTADGAAAMLEERIVLWFMRDLDGAARQKFFRLVDRPCSSYLAGQQKDLRQVLDELRAAAQPAQPEGEAVAQWVERSGKHIILWMRNKAGTHLRYPVLLESSQGDVLVDLEKALATPADAIEREREACATVALEQRCERGTPWDLACTTIAAAIRSRSPQDTGEQKSVGLPRTIPPDQDDECYCDFASREFFGNFTREHDPMCPQHPSQQQR